MKNFLYNNFLVGIVINQIIRKVPEILFLNVFRNHYNEKNLIQEKNSKLKIKNSFDKIEVFKDILVNTFLKDIRVVNLMTYVAEVYNFF